MIKKDKSGSISVDEIKEFLGKNANISDSVLKDLIKEVDINSDGEVMLRIFLKSIDFT